MQHYVYKITEISTGRFYIGKHTTSSLIAPLNDGYMGSGKKITMLLKKHGKKAFNKEILFLYDSEAEALQKEYDLIDENKLNPLCLNMAQGGCGDTSKNKHKRKQKKIKYFDDLLKNL
jgi:hypothetical protein